MLSYQHIYHAGNPADVHKHMVLCLLLAHLAAKPKPFAVLDLHAGEGDYGLGTPEALRNAEFRDGIGKLWSAPDAPDAVADYLRRVRSFNPEGALVRYPGSPALARTFLRADDRMILNELHPGAFRALKRWAGHDERIVLHKRDALEALVALVPPPVRRGLVLTDSSFEIKSDYAAVPAAVRRAYAKWPQGIFAVWYPMLKEGRHQETLDAFADDDWNAPVFAAEFITGKTEGLLGSGVIVVNPPWQIESAVAQTGAWLAARLGQGKKAGHSLNWLRPRADAAPD